MVDELFQLAVLLTFISITLYAIALPVKGISSPLWLPKGLFTYGKRGVRAFLQSVAHRLSQWGKELSRWGQRYDWTIAIPARALAGVLILIAWIIHLFVGKRSRRR